MKYSGAEMGKRAAARKESGGEDNDEADAGAFCGFLRSLGDLVPLWGLCGAP